jgi:type II secretory pathway component PulK
MIARSLHHRNRHGSALVLVFWCLLMLSLAVFAVVELVDLSVEHASHERLALEARALAASGVAIAQAPQLLRDDPLLRQYTAPGQGFHVTIEDESARLNLNYLLLTNHRDVLVNLFTSWGVKMDDAQHVADSLYDWVTPGDLPSLNGAKAETYARAGLPQRPSHQPFQSWQEVGLVLGMDHIAANKPNWQDSFTLWSDGPLDVNQAPAERIAALFGVEPGRVQQLVKIRDGRDGIPGTADDAPLNGLDVLQGELGLTDPQIKALQNEVTFGSTVRRIECVGQSGEARTRISVVVQVNTTPPQLLVWSER